MNEIEYWEDIVNKNNLKIERKATSCKKIQSLRFSNFFDGTEKLHVEFKINKDNKVISLVNQYINLELLDNHIGAGKKLSLSIKNHPFIVKNKWVVLVFF